MFIYSQQTKGKDCTNPGILRRPARQEEGYQIIGTEKYLRTRRTWATFVDTVKATEQIINVGEEAFTPRSECHGHQRDLPQIACLAKGRGYS